MKSILGPKSDRDRLGHVYEDIKYMGRKLRALSVLYVKRGANSVAHSLAKFARQIDGEIAWLEENPPPATKALYFDNSNIMNEWDCLWFQKIIIRVFCLFINEKNIFSKKTIFEVQNFHQKKKSLWNGHVSQTLAL